MKIEVPRRSKKCSSNLLKQKLAAPPPSFLKKLSESIAAAFSPPESLRNKARFSPELAFSKSLIVLRRSECVFLVPREWCAVPVTCSHETSETRPYSGTFGCVLPSRRRARGPGPGCLRDRLLRHAALHCPGSRVPQRRHREDRELCLQRAQPRAFSRAQESHHLGGRVLRCVRQVTRGRAQVIKGQKCFQFDNLYIFLQIIA